MSSTHFAELEQSLPLTRTFVIFNILRIVLKQRFILTEKGYETLPGTLPAKGSRRNNLFAGGDLAKTLREE